MGERLFQLVQLRRRSVRFQPDQIGDLHGLGEVRADIIEMVEESRGVRVSFPAKHFMAIDAEFIE